MNQNMYCFSRPWVEQNGQTWIWNTRLDNAAIYAKSNTLFWCTKKFQICDKASYLSNHKIELQDPPPSKSPYSWSLFKPGLKLLMTACFAQFCFCFVLVRTRQNYSNTWDIKHFVLAIKLDFLFCQYFDYVSDFASVTKTETKTDFSSDFILKRKSNFDFWPFVACVPCKNQN